MEGGCELMHLDLDELCSPLYDEWGEVSPPPLPDDASVEEKTLRELSAWPHELYKVLRWASSSVYGDLPSDDRLAADIADADIVSSKILNSDKHTIMLDLDVPATLVPSSTPGHSHLYIDVPNRWETLCVLLDALVAAGVVEHGYAEASKARGFTALRLPWVPKQDDA
jgi:hypothetical protein